MAVDAKPAAAGRDEGPAASRMAIGANVTLSVALALALAILVNWFASIKPVSRDVSTFGGYGLSDRTRTVLSGVDDEVRVTTAYLSTDPDKERGKFIGRLIAYGDELARAGKNVRVEHVATETGKAQLVRRIRDTYVGESGDHEKLVADFRALKGELDQSLQFGGASGAMSAAWLTGFPVFGSILEVLDEERRTLDSTVEEVTRLTSGGLPKYQEATAKVSEALTPLKDRLTKSQQALGDLARLSEEVARPDNPMFKTFAEVADALPGVVRQLREPLGAHSAEPPADVPAALKAFAAAAGEAGRRLEELADKLDAAVRAMPIIQSYSGWTTAMDSGMRLGQMSIKNQVDPPTLLEMIARDLQRNRQILLDVVDRADPENLGQNITALREKVLPGAEKILADAGDILRRVAETIGKIDPESAKLLEQAKGGQMFAAAIKSAGDMIERIGKLPELKLGSIAEQLKNDNIIVVEAGHQVRVLGFDDVWPMRDQLNAGAAGGEDRPRSFNGDSAVGSAILGLTSKQKFATVVLATFEVQPPPQMRQMMPPQLSTIPGESLSKLRERLTAANFAVKDWNLAEPAGPPEPEAGTKNIYIFPPPAPPNQPNPFMGQQPPSRTFGAPEMTRVQEVLDKGAGALFLACWEFRSSMFGFSTPEYGYRTYLKDQWGIDVDNARRVVMVEPDLRQPDTFGVSGEKFTYMTLNNFSDHLIGRSFRNSRVIALNACTLSRAEKVPEGVDVSSVLTVPAEEKYLAADVQQIISIINAIQNPESGGRVKRAGFGGQQTAYPVIMAATRKKENVESRIVVMGMGQSLSDEFMTRPILRQTPSGIQADPPPTINGDLAINTVHWLAGQESWIAAGPAPTPVIGPISKTAEGVVRLVAWGLLPAAVFAFGAYVSWSRRR